MKDKEMKVGMRVAFTLNSDPTIYFGTVIRPRKMEVEIDGDHLFEIADENMISSWAELPSLHWRPIAPFKHSDEE